MVKEEKPLKQILELDKSKEIEIKKKIGRPKIFKDDVKFKVQEKQTIIKFD